MCALSYKETAEISQKIHKAYLHVLFCVHQSNASWKLELYACAYKPKFALCPYSFSPNQWGNLHFRKACEWEKRNLSVLQLGTVMPRPAVQMGWAGHPSGLTPFLTEQMGKHPLQEQRIPKPLNDPACCFYRSRMLVRGGKMDFGIRREERIATCSLILDSFSRLGFCIRS